MTVLPNFNSDGSDGNSPRHSSPSSRNFLNTAAAQNSKD